MKRQEFFRKINYIKKELQECYELKNKIYEKKPFDQESFYSVKARISFLKSEKEKIKIKFHEDSGESISIGHYPAKKNNKEKIKKTKKQNNYLKDHGVST